MGARVLSDEGTEYTRYIRSGEEDHPGRLE